VATLLEEHAHPGFYSNGRVAPSMSNRESRLHNQTMTITWIAKIENADQVKCPIPRKRESAFDQPFYLALRDPLILKSMQSHILSDNCER